MPDVPPIASIGRAGSPRAADEPARVGRAARVGLLLVVVGGIVAVLLLPFERLLAAFFDEVRALGVWGPVLLALAWIPAAVLLVPGSILTLGAGFAFGVVVGTLSVSIGSVLGACSAFLVGRTVAREWVESRVARDARFTAVAEAVRREGWKIVLLTRLSPVLPFTLLNYAYGVTRVSFRDYALASWIGMLPGTILYVSLGAAARSLTQILAGDVSPGGGGTILLAVGLLATIAVTVVVTRAARRALRGAVAGADASRPGTAEPRP